ICFRPRTIERIIIETPFPNIPGHVFEAEWAGTERKRADRRAFRITVIDLRIAPGENGVLVGEIREIATAIMISPRVFALIVAFGGAFPFRLGRDAVIAALARA